MHVEMVEWYLMWASSQEPLHIITKKFTAWNDERNKIGYQPRTCKF